MTKKVDQEEYGTKKSDTKSTIMIEMTDRSVNSSKKYSQDIDDYELAKA